MTLQLLTTFLHGDSQNVYFQLPRWCLEMQYVLNTQVGKVEKYFDRIAYIIAMF